MKRYPVYKDSGLPWLGEIPKHWEIKRSKHFFREIDERSDSGDEELLSVSHITGVTPRSEKNITMFMAESYEGYKTCIPNDLVINIMWAWMGALGVSKYRGIISSAYGVYRAKDKNSFNFEYLDYLVRIPEYIAEYTRRSKGIRSSRLRMYSDDFFQLPIICPPPKEQKTIAHFLDYKIEQIEQYIRNKQRLIELLNEQKTAIINRAVTKGINPNAPMKHSGIEWLGEIPAHWEIDRIGRLSESLQTGPFGSKLHSKEYVSGGIPVINPSNMRYSKIVPDLNCAIDKPTWERLKRHALEIGDIIFARRGEMGRCALVTEKESGWICGTGSLRMRPKAEKTIREFLIMVLSAQGVAEYLSLMSVGSTMENLNTGILERLPIPLPPIEEQKKIIEFIKKKNLQVDLAIAQIEKEIELIQEYRTTLISDAVTGKIDVRGFDNAHDTGNSPKPLELATM